MTPVDASINPEDVRYIIFASTKIKRKPKIGDYVRNADKCNIIFKGYTSDWNRELFRVNEVLKTQPSTYKKEDINGEIAEGKYNELELLKPGFDFEPNNKVLESLNIVLSVNKYKEIQRLQEIDSTRLKKNNQKLVYQQLRSVSFFRR